MSDLLNDSQAPKITLEEYINESKKITQQTDEFVAELVESFERVRYRNAKILIDLLESDHNFKLFDRDGEPIQIVRQSFDGIKRVFVSVKESENIYFELYWSTFYQYHDEEDHMDLISEADLPGFLPYMFKDIEFYQDVMHIIGVSGVLIMALDYQKKLLNDVKSMFN